MSAHIYSESERAFFARYWDARAKLRPVACHLDEGPRCWVLEGPPAYDTSSRKGVCIGCGAQPLYPRERRGRYRR